MARSAARAEPDVWTWAAVGVNSQRARGTAESRDEAVSQAIARVGPLQLVELRDPSGNVTRLGKLVDGRELPGTAA
ncbi:hypothetical protein AMYX_01680 [Anaeromyxobacter diazotrophicus]|uniref:Uncharacterized protein n=1 Tax=Anaeromyxobacter diazotrophicus TaxID=2590199 RepID=A0A7I9VHA8_9BACT|nr:hypothetical protein AMYX_01680 [Anaeromyxobacter diazotrophicus]